MKIPLVDLAAQHREIEEDIRAGLARVVADTSFVLGPVVEEFEREFAALCGVAHCIGVGNGTDALELALRALEVGPGDEVILPTNTFVASALAVVRAGATPVLVDCDAHHLLTASASEERIGERTRAIMPVDLFGQLPCMEEIEALASASGVYVVEDAAQAQGARRHSRVAGSFGAIAGTSFYPGKNLGAYGDAGAVMTDDPDLGSRMRRLRNYGSERKYDHPELGFNSRLDSIQAVVLRAKLARLPAWNEQRRRAAARYDELLADVDVERPEALPDNEHVWHLYVVRVRERDRVLAALRDADIGAGVHYPVPIHLQGAFAQLGHGVGSFPQAERAAGEMLSLPIFPGIREEQQGRVVDVLRRALG